ncbi:hypothetical protein V5738_01165 [Salinisphaera sp. SPP-AMP-43]|uniref:hypothetical protein n=1 Tax=Salinisphaera sp. SPP-AMP-43 TaxID=3121288 RepID=UPI003C6E72DD
MHDWLPVDLAEAMAEAGIEATDTARATLHVAGRSSPHPLFISLGELDGVTSVRIENAEG